MLDVNTTGRSISCQFNCEKKYDSRSDYPPEVLWERKLARVPKAGELLLLFVLFAVFRLFLLFRRLLFLRIRFFIVEVCIRENKRIGLKMFQYRHFQWSNSNKSQNGTPSHPRHAVGCTVADSRSGHINVKFFFDAGQKPASQNTTKTRPESWWRAAWPWRNIKNRE